MEMVLETKVRNLQGQGLVNIDYLRLSEESNRLEGFLFSLHHSNPAIDLVSNHDGRDYLIRVHGVDDAVVAVSFRTICQAFNPSVAVDADQIDRSRSSRRFLVLNPLIIPLVSEIGRTGTYCNTPPFAIATILSPGLIPASLLTSSGITT